MQNIETVLLPTVTAVTLFVNARAKDLARLDVTDAREEVWEWIDKAEDEEIL